METREWLNVIEQIKQLEIIFMKPPDSSPGNGQISWADFMKSPNSSAGFHGLTFRSIWYLCFSEVTLVLVKSPAVGVSHRSSQQL